MKPAYDQFMDHRPVNHSSIPPQRKIGILLLNLGTPEGTSYWPMRRYLSEFLSDRRVIEMSPWKWQPLLQLVILTTRPLRKGWDYKKIWNRERNEGPLKTITRSQAEKLQIELGKEVAVDWAMRYGFPTIESRLAELQKQGCDRILFIPLYPQYCAATTATACDKAFDALKKMRWQPSIRVAPPWYDDPVYIEALAGSIHNSLAKLDFKPDIILASYHGVPEDYVRKGDPYYDQCIETTKLLRQALGRDASTFVRGFQSRFGKSEWVKPYTDEMLLRAADSGGSMAVVAPGFAADCLETLEELAIENRDIFLKNGGEKFAYLPALNDSPEGMRVITHVARRELQGWL